MEPIEPPLDPPLHAWIPCAEAQEIQLWRDGRCNKLGNTDSTQPPKRRSSTVNIQSATQEEVEEIHLKLKENMLTTTHLHSCVYELISMLQIGSHKDYNLPPGVPMFGGKKRSAKNTLRLLML